MNKKKLGMLFVMISLVLALLKSYVWVMIGLLVAAVVFACEEKYVKRIAQCLLLVLSVMAVTQIFVLIFGGFAATSGSVSLESIITSALYGSNAGGYTKFYVGLIKWVGIVLNFYLVAFTVLGAIFFLMDKDMPVYGTLVDLMAGGIKITIQKNEKTQAPASNNGNTDKTE